MPENFSSPSASPTRIVAMRALTIGITFYQKTGMPINPAYTPIRMRRAATRFTGKAFSRGDAGLQAAKEALFEALVAARFPMDEDL
jgi:hypothetical protein